MHDFVGSVIAVNESYFVLQFGHDLSAVETTELIWCGGVGGSELRFQTVHQGYHSLYLAGHFVERHVYISCLRFGWSAAAAGACACISGDGYFSIVGGAGEFSDEGGKEVRGGGAGGSELCFQCVHQFH